MARRSCCSVRIRSGTPLPNWPLSELVGQSVFPPVPFLTQCYPGLYLLPAFHLTHFYRYLPYPTPIPSRVRLHGSHASPIGGKVCGASPAYNVEEMSFALKTADAKFLFTVPDSLAVAISATANASIPRGHIFLLEGKVEGFTTIQDLIAVGRSYGQHGQSLPYSIPKDQTNRDVCGFLCFSSGTTGLPKVVSQRLVYVLQVSRIDLVVGYAVTPKHNRPGFPIENDQLSRLTKAIAVSPMLHSMSPFCPSLL
jgi:acyl-CoA synthetase (AMP-forming)/AMP-acid ligase II